MDFWGTSHPENPGNQKSTFSFRRASVSLYLLQLIPIILLTGGKTCSTMRHTITLGQQWSCVWTHSIYVLKQTVCGTAIHTAISLASTRRIKVPHHPNLCELQLHESCIIQHATLSSVPCCEVWHRKTYLKHAKEYIVGSSIRKYTVKSLVACAVSITMFLEVKLVTHCYILPLSLCSA